MEGSSGKKRVKYIINETPWRAKGIATTSARSEDPARRIDHSRLFANAEEMNRFSKKFMNKQLITPHYIDCDVTKAMGFTFQDAIIHQGLSQFVFLNCSYFDTLVQAFYSNMNVDDGVLTCTLANKTMVITAEVWGSVIGLKQEGITLCSNYDAFANFDKTAALEKMLQDSSHIPGASKLIARLGDMDLLLLWAWIIGL